VPDFPKKDYQVYALESFRQSVRALWDAADLVEQRLQYLSKHGLDEIIPDVRKFYCQLNDLKLGTPRGSMSGTMEALFLMRDYAHKLQLLIPHLPKEEPCPESSDSKNSVSSPTGPSSPSTTPA